MKPRALFLDKIFDIPFLILKILSFSDLGDGSPSAKADSYFVILFEIHLIVASKLENILLY
ncbi:hypothetical protein JWG44_09465 [Leptospira sp. 201903071]|uniref:hypothetical protein n=1 Tax=Leptospira ainazelensis TaxID=2810034 RepID=UPI0019635121|nr:hypothetical protein [Leptospira ainazelensis]MBM9500473.1 hypothetical protein [Leptospira ainazelensis]